MESTVPQWTFKLISTLTTAETWDLKGCTLKVNVENVLAAAAILFEGF
jgi:hypothetical protein